MNGKREPGLQTHIDQADVRVIEVMVVVQALAWFATQFEFLLRAVGTHFVRPATLNTLEDADQPLVNAVSLGEFPSPGFLIHVTVVQVPNRAPLAGSHFLCCLAHLSGDVAGKRLEVLEQHVSLPQVREHSIHIGEEPPRAAKSNAIETVHHTQDAFAKAFDKILHDVAFPVDRDGCLRQLHSMTRKQRFLASPRETRKDPRPTAPTRETLGFSFGTGKREGGWGVLGGGKLGPLVPAPQEQHPARTATRSSDVLTPTSVVAAPPR